MLQGVVLQLTMTDNLINEMYDDNTWYEHVRPSEHLSDEEIDLQKRLINKPLPRNERSTQVDLQLHGFLRLYMHSVLCARARINDTGE